MFKDLQWFAGLKTSKCVVSCEICPCGCVDVCLYVCCVRVCVFVETDHFIWVSSCVCLACWWVSLLVFDCHCGRVVSLCRANVYVCGVCCVLRMCVCVFCIQVTFAVFKFQDVWHVSCFQLHRPSFIVFVFYL